MQSKINSAKEQLRQQFLLARSNITSEEALRNAVVIKENFFKVFPTIKHDVIIAGYVAIKNEIDVLPILKHLHEMHHKIALPVIAERKAPLKFYDWSFSEEFCTNSLYGVLEPGKGRAFVDPSIIITPIVACARNGYRLGYGGGFYDRTLAHYRNSNHKVISVGVCFHCQLTDTLPHNITDQKVDIIITEQEIIIINQSIVEEFR